MPLTQKHPFTIEEVTSPRSPYLAGMNRWLEEIFPEYCPARFDRLLMRLRHLDGRHQVQIFIGLVENQVVGLMQMLFQPWQAELLADIDLLGVLESFRRRGLATALLQRSLQVTQEMAQSYRMSAVGVATLIDPTYAPVVRLHKKLGGQIRSDDPYPNGELIVWYPLQRKYELVATPILVEQLQQFGFLLES